MLPLAKVTDPAGNVLFVSKGDADQAMLEHGERAQIPLVPPDRHLVFTLPGNRWEGVSAIYTGNQLRGYAWVEFDKSWRSRAIGGNPAGHARLRHHLDRGFGPAGSYDGPLHHAAAGRCCTAAPRSLMTSPEDSNHFPLPVRVHNEIGDLIETFNRMVASLAEQRAGLNDTLSLLDSMLANAPIGLAFVDRNCRFVRVNQVFADLTGVAVSRHLGRTLPELLPQPLPQQMENAVQQRLFARRASAQSGAERRRRQSRAGRGPG